MLFNLSECTNFKLLWNTVYVKAIPMPCLVLIVCVCVFSWKEISCRMLNASLSTSSKRLRYTLFNRKEGKSRPFGFSGVLLLHLLGLPMSRRLFRALLWLLKIPLKTCSMKNDSDRAQLLTNSLS